MNKKIKISVALGVIISSIGITSAFAAGGIKSVVISDSKIYLENKPILLMNSLVSIIKDGDTNELTYVPARELLEKMGYSIAWNSTDNSIHLSPKVISTFDELHSQRFPLIAADYEESAYLYGIDTDFTKGVVLQYSGVSKAFNWVWTTPRFILPIMQVFDYENSGKKEVAISVNVDSGTGLSIDELHIIKANDGDLIDNQFIPEDYIKQISDKVSYTVTDNKGKVLIKIVTEKSGLTIDITEYIKEISAKDSDIKLAYGNIIEFTPKEEGKIELKAGLGVCSEKQNDPMYIADIKADVTYSNGIFILSDIQLNKN